MNKIKIHIGIIGYLPFEFNRKKIKRWQSDLFEITRVEDYKIKSKRSDTGGWGYTDSLLNKELPNRDSEDIFIGITYVPIQGDYFARRLSDNRVIVSLFGTHRYLSENNISAENLLMRFVYLAVTEFYIEKNASPANMRRLDLLHDDTRGCIFDMVGNRGDIIYSLDRPKLCSSCVTQLQDYKVPKSTIDTITKELKRIKKGRYYTIESFIKRRPVLSIVITFVVGVIMSMVASYLYEFLKCIIKRL